MGKSLGAQAGLKINVARIRKRMTGLAPTKRIGGTAPIYAAGILEFVTREILAATRETTRLGGKKRITPRDVLLSIRNDDDLHRLFAGLVCLTGSSIKEVAKVTKLEADKRYSLAREQVAAA